MGLLCSTALPRSEHFPLIRERKRMDQKNWMGFAKSRRRRLLGVTTGLRVLLFARYLGNLEPCVPLQSRCGCWEPSSSSTGSQVCQGRGMCWAQLCSPSLWLLVWAGRAASPREVFAGAENSLAVAGLGEPFLLSPALPAVRGGGTGPAQPHGRLWLTPMGSRSGAVGLTCRARAGGNCTPPVQGSHSSP